MAAAGTAMQPAYFGHIRGFIAGAISAITQPCGVTLQPYFTRKDPILRGDRRGQSRTRERCEQRTYCMDHRIASARPLGRTLTAAGLLAVLLVAAPAFGQTPPKQPAKPAAPKQAPAAKPAEAAPAAAPTQAGEPQLMYSPWMKVCGKGPDTNNKQVCVITKDGRL